MGWQKELEGDAIGHPTDALMTFWEAADIQEEGSQAFEDRRAELALLREVDPEEVSDEQVVRSFKEALSQNGLLRQYLERSQLAVLLGDALFINGQLKNNALTNTCEATEDVFQRWIIRLNDWGHMKLREMDGNTDWDTIPRPE